MSWSPGGVIPTPPSPLPPSRLATWLPSRRPTFLSRHPHSWIDKIAIKAYPYVMGKGLLSTSRSKAMEESRVPLREHRRQVRECEVRLTPRKVGILQCQAEPEQITGPILSALRKGHGPKSAAGAAGCTLDELKYMVFLGEMGHGAYTVFFEEYNRARAQAAAELEEVRRVRALAAAREENLVTAGAADVKAGLETVSPEDHGEMVKRGGGDGGERGDVNIKLIQRFEKPVDALPPGGGVMPVVDAEYTEGE